MANKLNKFARAVTCAWLIGSTLLASAVSADAAELSGLSITPSDPRPSVTAVEYSLKLAGASTGVDNSCVEITFNTQSDGTGTFPSGMSVAGVTLDAAKSSILPTPASWTVSAVGNTIRIDYTAGGNTQFASASGSLTVDGITNSFSAGTYYVDVHTFANAGCTGAVDSGQSTVIIHDDHLASVEVDPTFTIVINSQPAGTSCAGSTSTAATTASSVPFGKVFAGNFGVAVQQVRVSSNAAGGYLVYLRSTGVMTASGGTIADFASNVPASFPGSTTAAFGFTSGDSDLVAPFGAGQWAGNLASVASPGHTVARGPSSVTYSADDTCVGYRVNIAETTKSGTYVTNLIYTAAPTF